MARNRIFSTAPASATCAGAVRVAGHSLRSPVNARDHALSDLGRVRRLDTGALAPPPRRATPDLEPELAAIVAQGAGRREAAARMALALRLASVLRREVERPAPGRRWDKPVAALLVGADGTLLEWATNTGSGNSTSHAEVNLVELWLARNGGGLPRGGRLFSTLKPCKMCAGLVWDSATDPLDLRVLYAEEDPRRYARETGHASASMDRRRVVAGGDGLTRVVQVRLAAGR